VHNPFLQRDLPPPSPWTKEKQLLWQETRRLGRVGYALRYVAVRFASGDLVRLAVSLLLLSLLGLFFRVLDGGWGSIRLGDLFVLFEVAPWFPFFLLGMLVIAGFSEGWLRWGLYEGIAAVRSGASYQPSALAGYDEHLVALLQPVFDEGGPSMVLAYNGQRWQTGFVNDREEILIDVLMRPDGCVLLTRAGGDLMTINASGAVSVRSTGQEGAYLAPVGPDRCLLAGTPFSLWYELGSQDLQRVEAQTATRPVVHGERVYLVDNQQCRISILGCEAITHVPFSKGRRITALAVTPDGSLFAAERTGFDSDRGRIVRCEGEAWRPLRAPFSRPIHDLIWEDGRLLASTEQGLYRYEPDSDSWDCESEGGDELRFLRLAGRLAVFNARTGALLTRKGTRWETEPVSVPLDAVP
jgi:hypothetical protein